MKMAYDKNGSRQGSRSGVGCLQRSEACGDVHHASNFSLPSFCNSAKIKLQLRLLLEGCSSTSFVSDLIS